MLLTVDVGNSNIVLGVFKDEELSFIARIATDVKKTADEYAIQFNSIIRIHGIKPEELCGAALSSVVPQLTSSVEQAIMLLTGSKPFTVGTGIKTGMNIKIDNPAQLGSDILVDCVAASALYPLPVIVADMGTATVMTVVTEPKNILGGVILPGIMTSLSALVEKTAQLPQISLETPKKAIGSNTVDCMKSGIVFGTASMLDGIIDRFEGELGEKCFVVATGGLSSEIVRHTKHKVEYNPTLLLHGLRILYAKNREIKQ